MNEIVKAFLPHDRAVAITPHGNGNINKTVKVETAAGHTYILQKINRYVFKQPEQVMKNVCAVTGFLQKKSDRPHSTLTFMPAQDGRPFHRDAQGEYWRMCPFIPGFCLETPESPEDFYQSALAFGRFQHLLSDFPAHTLHETIPGYHNTVSRFAQLKNSIAADVAGRADTVRTEIDFALQREETGGRLQRMLEAGELPLRVTHNDTKLNNVLLDPVTRTSLCVLDLDTVMPGLTAHDFGDAVRFGAATAAEDEPDTAKMGLDLTLFEAFARGFLEAVPTLTPTEISVLPLGALVITLELAIRFLTDYLDGDLYFHTAYPEHNLVRARTQLALVADMEKKWDAMNRIVTDLTAAKKHSD